jgi:hypothetical protein
MTRTHEGQDQSQKKARGPTGQVVVAKEDYMHSFIGR